MTAPPLVGLALTTATALAKHPRLWPTAARSAWSLVPNRWWARQPYLPLPDRRWLSFRMVTAYGGNGRYQANTPVRAEDLITWLDWQRSYRYKS